ncbi:hypothetical protein ACLXAZ_32745, partial [Escherichia coli]
GEPTWNGRILHTHYATGQQAEALVEHGDIRCLGPRCDKPAGHTLQNPVDGVTAYYGRDSGFRMDSEAREYRSFREAIATESTEEVRFHYVFIDGYWKVMVSRPGTVASCIPTMPPVSRPKPWLNTVISVALV